MGWRGYSFRFKNNSNGNDPGQAEAGGEEAGLGSGVSMGAGTNQGNLRKRLFYYRTYFLFCQGEICTLLFSGDPLSNLNSLSVQNLDP